MNSPFAGTLRTRIRFDRPAYNRDRSGERVKTWEPAFHAWARVQSSPARNEGLVAGGPLATSTHQIHLRHRTDIKADMSVYLLPDGPRLDILTEPVDPDGSRERTLLHCEYRGGAA